MSSSGKKGLYIILIFLVFLSFLTAWYITKNACFCVAGFILFIVSWMIYSQIHEHYAQSDPKLKELRGVMEEFFNRKNDWKAPLDVLNGKNIMKEITLYRGEKSYTINKERVYICLKDTNGEYYDDNTLYYVIGHELSHTICDEIGHTQKFHDIFEALLENMEKAGIYNSDIPMTQDYCKNGDLEM